MARAPDARPKCAHVDQDENDKQRVRGNPGEALSGAKQTPHRKQEHALWFGQRSAEILRPTPTRPQRAKVGCADGQHRCGPAQSRPQRAMLGGITGRRQKNDIGNAVRNFVIQLARRGFPASFDGNKSVQHVREQAQLNACCREQKEPRRSITPGAQQQKSPAHDCEADARQGNLIRADPQSGQSAGQILSPSGRPRIHRPPIGIKRAVWLLGNFLHVMGLHRL